MAKFSTERSLPKSDHTSSVANKFINSAELKTATINEKQIQDYPWLDPSLNDSVKTSCCFEMRKTLSLKIDYICKQVMWKKRVLYELALEQYVDAWLKEHNIPNE